METTTPWQDSVSPRRVRAVQLATALFSLSRFYVEAPTTEITRRFTDPQMAATWPIRDEASVAAMERIADANEVAFILNEEFTAMFGPAGTMKMAESEYTGQNHVPLVQELNALYTEHGYSPQKTTGYPRDHFAVQLGFLGHMVAGVAADDSVLETIRDFREDHLDHYAGDLLDHVERQASTEMYRGVTVMTRATLAALSEIADE